MHNLTLKVLVSGSVSLLLNGCAQYIAYHQPPPLDHSVLALGADRSHINAVLGAPVDKEDNADGTVTDTYKYADGGAKNSAASKTGRILLYTAGDLFTAFLDQVIWMPLELAFRPTEYTADVTYEKPDHHWVAREIRETDVADQKVVREVGTPDRRLVRAAQ